MPVLDRFSPMDQAKKAPGISWTPLEARKKRTYCLPSLSIYRATCVKAQKRPPESRAAAGRVKTLAAASLRMFEIYSPLRLAAMVPATPELSTCVVETGKPKLSAAKIVAMATNSAQAP